jgi:hypothetical protein
MHIARNQRETSSKNTLIWPKPIQNPPILLISRFANCSLASQTTPKLLFGVKNARFESIFRCFICDSKMFSYPYEKAYFFSDEFSLPIEAQSQKDEGRGPPQAAPLAHTLNNTLKLSKAKVRR